MANNNGNTVGLWSSRRKRFLAITAALAAPLIAMSCSTGGTAGTSTTSSSTASTGTTSNAPGVTPTKIVTGAISTLTGPLTADLNGIVPGVRAYFDMVNAQGGINGRKLDLAYSLNDEGNPSEFSTLAQQLVEQDHVFAVTGVGTDFFSPGILRETGTPTYGFNTTGGWAGPPNLFGSDASIQCYSCLAPSVAYLAKQTKSKSLAMLAYNVSASSDLCATSARLLKNAGVNVSYEDFSVPIDGDLAPDVQRIKSAGSDMVVSCMDVTGNISLARAIQQYGLEVNQLWFNGYDQSVIDHYTNLMQGVYFFVPTVPLTAPGQYYPGLANYLSAMHKYEPAYVSSALAPEGWVTGALFAAGVRAAGTHLTQARVVELTNQISSFNGDGLIAPLDWTDGHTTPTGIPPGYPVCAAFTRVEGSTLKSVYGKGHQVYVCLGTGAVKNPVPLTPPPGTPGS
jgi:branched-chain amino acid transport system substrate-binding protein